MTHGIWSDIYVLSQHRTPNLISNLSMLFYLIISKMQMNMKFRALQMTQ